MEQPVHLPATTSIESFSDLEAWFARSRRPPEWHAAARWALAVSRGALGEDWPGRASRAGWLPPEFFMAPSHTLAFASLLEVAATLESLQGLPGLAKLRTSLARDLRPQNWKHGLAQLEVARLAAAAGATVTLEALQGSYPVDVLVRGEQITAGIEVFVILMSESWRSGVERSDAIKARVDEIERRHAVACSLDFHGESLDDDEVDLLLRQLDLAASKVASTKAVRVRVGAAAAELSRRGASSYRGPLIAESPWRRIASRLATKTMQTRMAEQAMWLRVDLLGGIWQFSPWSQLPLPEKARLLAAQVRYEIGVEWRHLAGVIVSSGCVYGQGQHENETIHDLGGVGALRRLVDPMRVRETIFIAADESDPAALRWLLQAYAREPFWLPQKLAGNGLPTLAEMFPREPTST